MRKWLVLKIALCEKLFKDNELHVATTYNESYLCHIIFKMFI